MVLILGVLSGEHANYTKIIIEWSSLFTQFMISLLYWRPSTQIPLIFITISKTNYLIINHLICTTPDTEQIVILTIHYLIIQKLKTVISKKVIPIWNSLVKRVCHILICCFLYSVFYSLLRDIVHFLEIKFSIYFENTSALILNFLVHKTDSAFALAGVDRIEFDRKDRLRQRNHALN